MALVNIAMNQEANFFESMQQLTEYFHKDYCFLLMSFFSIKKVIKSNILNQVILVSSLISSAGNRGTPGKCGCISF